MPDASVGAPERGALFVATGRGYADIAVDAARSVRAVAPGLPIDLFTDPETAEAGLPEGIFDRIEALPNAWARSKIDGMARSRFARTIYLDADIRALTDFTDAFDLLDRFDLAVAQEQWRNAETAHVLWRRELPASFPQVNSGVMVYRGGPEVRAFFARWAEAVREHGIGRDQPALRELLWETDLRFAILPDSWNLMDWPMIRHWGPTHAMPRILHSVRFHKHFTAPPMPRVDTAAALIGPVGLARLEELDRADRALARLRGEAPRPVPAAQSRRRRRRAWVAAALRRLRGGTPS